MKSTIKFDLTEDNKACVIIDRDATSDDLRDKVARQFIEDMGYVSSWLAMAVIPDTSKYMIRPIGTNDLQDVMYIMARRLADNSEDLDTRTVYEGILNQLRMLPTKKAYTNDWKINTGNTVKVPNIGL